jgi:ankyrin repeat protein
MVRLLLEAGADPTLPDRTGESPLILAARSGSADIVQALLERGVEADAREPHYDQTPLMVAVRAAAPEVVRLLLDKGADVNAQSRLGEVPEFRLPSSQAGSRGLGIIRGGWPEHGSRAPVGGAKTPLLYATRQGDLALTRLLVEAGADLEQSDGNGVTPLLNAILNGSVVSLNRAQTQHIEVARYLIERGANVNVSDWYGETPLWTAVLLRDLDVSGPADAQGVDRAAALELIRLLLERGGNPNARTQEYAPERRFITGLGDLSWVDFSGQTPFLHAALSGDVTVMNLLLEHGAAAAGLSGSGPSLFGIFGGFGAANDAVGKLSRGNNIEFYSVFELL